MGLTGPLTGRESVAEIGHPVPLTHRPRLRADPARPSDPDAARTDAAAWAGDLLVALGTCDTADATMVSLVYFDGLSYRRVAERLALPLARVEVGVARGLQCLGRALTSGAPE